MESSDPRRIHWAKLVFFAGLALVGLVAFAYFDGGEEPIRPIVQQVEVPARAAQDIGMIDAESPR